jgi:hypothetical protein
VIEMRGPVTKKDLAIETRYGYMNIHLELLFKALKENDSNEIGFQISQLKKIVNALTKLGYFERGK